MNNIFIVSMGEVLIASVLLISIALLIFMLVFFIYLAIDEVKTGRGFTPPPSHNKEDGVDKEKALEENNDEYDFGHNVSHHTLDGEGDI